MAKRERSLASTSKVAEGDPKSPSANLTPMQKFNQLARRVVNVPREELRHEQECYDAANAIRRSQRKRKGHP